MTNATNDIFPDDRNRTLADIPAGSALHRCLSVLGNLVGRANVLGVIFDRHVGGAAMVLFARLDDDGECEEGEEVAIIYFGTHPDADDFEDASYEDWDRLCRKYGESNFSDENVVSLTEAS